MKKIEQHRMPELDKEVVSIDFSAIDCYLRCGRQFEYRYVHNLKQPPAIALIEGSSHHKAMEHNNNNKKLKGKDLNPSDLTDVFISDLRSRVKVAENLDWEGEDENKIHSRAKIIHHKYINEIAPQFEPELVEHKFEKKIKFEGVNYLIYGTIDLTLKSNELYDYKTASKAKSQNEVDNSLQLSLYSFASGIKDVGIIQLLKKANPDVGIIKSVRNANQLKWALKIAVDVIKAVKLGVFIPCNPQGWNCSPMYCGYFDKCRGAK